MQAHKGGEPDTGDRIHVGCSGWQYSAWRGRFYPEGLPTSRWLAFYCQHFNTVELNNTFYRLPAEATVAEWVKATPSNFVFAVKGSRYITHVRRLIDVAAPIQDFVARIAPMGSKLGPILWQLPPTLLRNDERLKAFLGLLPSGVRHTLEFRHNSWWHDDVYTLLQQHNVALCLIDWPGFRSPVVTTSDFTYLRFHGTETLYGGLYSDESLSWWAQAAATISTRQQTVYAYFNNDANAYAVRNALTFRGLTARS